MRLRKPHHNAIVRIQLEIEVDSQNPLYQAERMNGYDQDYWIREGLEAYFKQRANGVQEGDQLQHDTNARCFKRVLSTKRTRVLTTKREELIYRPDHRLADGSTVLPPGAGGEGSSETGGSVGSSGLRRWEFAVA